MCVAQVCIYSLLHVSYHVTLVMTQERLICCFQLIDFEKGVDAYVCMYVCVHANM